MNIDTKPCYCGAFINSKTFVEHIFKCKQLNKKFDKLMKSIIEVGKNASYTDLDLLCMVSDYVKNESEKMRNILNKKSNLQYAPSNQLANSEIMPRGVPVMASYNANNYSNPQVQNMNQRPPNLKVYENKQVYLINPISNIAVPQPIPNNIMPPEANALNEQANHKKEGESQIFVKEMNLMENHFEEQKNQNVIIQNNYVAPVNKEAIIAPLNDIEAAKKAEGAKVEEEVKQINKIEEPIPEKPQINNQQLIQSPVKANNEIDEIKPILDNSQNNEKEERFILVEQIKCWKCKKEQNMGNTLFTAKCKHIVCITCLKELTISQLPKDSTVKCQCGVAYAKSDILQAVTNEKYDELLNMGELASLITECPMCHAQFIIDAGKVDYNICDNKGAKLSRECAEDFCINRVRCGGCGKDFCKNCHMAPYHLGMTCKQNAHMASAVYILKQKMPILQGRN